MLSRILLVDDSEPEAMRVKQLLREAGLADPIHYLRESEEAIRYLQGTDIYSDRNRFPLPDVLLVDLAMPGIDGFQLLRWLRSERELARIVVIILADEVDLRRIQLAYQLGATSFLLKQAPLDEYQHFVRFFREYTHISRCLPLPGQAGRSLPAPSCPEPAEHDRTSRVRTR